MRPRGLDRDELEERLRMRRPGDAPYRRGASPEEPQYGSPQLFQPEPEDELAKPSAPGMPPPRNIDNLPPDYDEPAWERAADETRYEQPPYVEQPPYEGQPRYDEQPRYEEPSARQDAGYGSPFGTLPPPVATPPAPAHQSSFAGDPQVDEADRAPAHEPPAPELEDDEYLDEYDYPYDSPAYDEPRRSGSGPLMFIGFGALGLAALLAGVLLSGLFGPGKGIAQQTPSPTPTATVTAEATPTPGASAPAESQSPGASDGPPVAFDDGFTADVQPCAEEPTESDGCDSSGAQVAAGDKLWVWIGFTRGTNDDVIGITLVDSGGQSVADASFDLSSLGAEQDRFNGWLKFSFDGLSSGDYKIRVSRNGTPAAETAFTVS
jgi:hypothetical protein